MKNIKLKHLFIISIVGIAMFIILQNTSLFFGQFLVYMGPHGIANRKMKINF